MSPRFLLPLLAVLALGACTPAVAPAQAPAAAAAASEVERNKAAVVRWLVEGDDKGNPAIADEIFAPDVVMHHPTSPTPLRGVEVIKQGSMGLHKTFPGFKGERLDVFGEGDRVVVRWSLSGTHQGEFMGIPATNKPFTLTGTTIYKLAGGKVVEAWYAADMMGFYAQIGATPPGTPPAASPAPSPSPAT